MSLIDTDRALPEYQATRPATFHVLGADPDEARQAAKDEARRAGLRVVTVATVRRDADPDARSDAWVVALACRGER